MVGRNVLVPAGCILVMTAFAMSGCGSSDPIQSSNGPLSIQAILTPAENDRFEVATLRLSGVVIVPEDPTAQSAIGGAGQTISPLPGSVSVDLRSTTPLAVSSTPLSPGRYLVQSVTVDLSGMRLRDTDFVDPGVGAPCVDRIAAFPADSNSAPPGVLFVPVPPGLAVSIDSGKSTTLALKIDGPGLATAFQNAFSCDPNFPDPIHPGSVIPTLTGFDIGQFTTAFSGLVSLE